jgi:hypothetical protein
MYLSAERLAVANKAIQETFEQTSVAWQAIPHWDTGDPGQVQVRSDIMAPLGVGPYGGNSIPVKTEPIPFYVTLAQACAPTPDALLAALMPRTVELAKKVDDYVIGELRKISPATTTPPPPTITQPAYVQEVLDALIDARVKVEDAGYRAPSCLLASTAALKAISHLVSGVPVTESLLDAANINSLYRVRGLDDPPGPVVDSIAVGTNAGAGKPAAKKAAATKASAGKGTAPTGTPTPKTVRIMLMLGRMQRIAHGCAAMASPGEEPVDLAISVPPSLEVVGETTQNYIELALRIRYALRIKDERGVVPIDYYYTPPS